VPALLQTFTANGTQSTFTLNQQIPASSDALVFVDTVIQTPITNYTISGYDLIFVSAPSANSSILVRTLGNYSSRAGFVDNFVANGSQFVFNLSGTGLSSTSLLVFVDGVYQIPDTDFSFSGNSVVFTGAPEANANVVVQAINTTLGQGQVIADPDAVSVGTVDTVIDSFGTGFYRTAKYIISVTGTSSYQSTEALVLHDGNIAQLVTYATVYTGNSQIMTFSANVAAGQVRVYGAGTAVGNTVKVQKTYVRI
jgi:hypothetical protein